MRASFFLPVFAIVAACGGANEYALIGTPEVDSVHGTLKVEAADGGKSLVRAVLDELPPPGRVGEGNAFYVAWAKPLAGETVALGALDYDGVKRQGRIEAIAPHRAFTFLVTAETEASPDAPSDLKVAERRAAARD